MDMAWVRRREWFCCSPYLVQKNLWRSNILNARWSFRDRESFFLQACGCFRFTTNAPAGGLFNPWVGGLVRSHIAMGVFSEECFPCLSPTTVFVVVPDAWLHILFTLRKRRKNEEIEAHSLHTASHPDADLSTLEAS